MGLNYRVFCGVCMVIIALLIIKDVFLGFTAVTGQTTAEAALDITQQQLDIQEAQLQSLRLVQQDLESCLARVATCEDGREAQLEVKELRQELTELSTFLNEYTAAANDVKADVIALNGLVDTWIDTTAKISVLKEDLIIIQSDYELVFSSLQYHATVYNQIVLDNQDIIDEFGGLVLIPDEQLSKRIDEAREDLKKFDFTIRQLEY